jgi:NAD(P)-dependent dehydrogenase (short-subunit alcohol dehydrogenase family)
LELAIGGITVNVVAPRLTKTELFRANNPPDSAGEASYLSGVPMRRWCHGARARSHWRSWIGRVRQVCDRKNR